MFLILLSELVPQNPNIEYSVVAVFFGLMILVLIFALIAFVLLFYNYNHPVIRKNTPLMSLIVLLGTIFVLIGGIVLSTDVNDASCIIFLLFCNIGLAMSLGGLVAKSYRLYRIFYNRSANAVVISDLNLLLIVFIIALYFALICTVSLIDGYGAAISQSSSNRFYLFYECTCDSEFWQTFLTIFCEVSFILLLFVALGYAWVTRKIVSAYSESQAVTALVLFYLCLDICFLPLYYVMGSGTGSAVYKTIIKLFYIFLTTSLTLILLFYARFYDVYQYEKRLKKRARESQAE